MLIASRFKRPHAPVTIGGAEYFFRPINPADANSLHVCEVANKDHIQRFLGITEGYFLPDDETIAAQSPKLAAKPAAPAAPPAPPSGSNAGDATQTNAGEGEGGQGSDGETKPPPQGADSVVALPEEIREQAANLSELSWQKLKSETAKGGIPLQVLHEARRLELAKPEEDQRSTILKILDQAIEAG